MNLRPFFESVRLRKTFIKHLSFNVLWQLIYCTKYVHYISCHKTLDDKCLISVFRKRTDSKNGRRFNVYPILISIHIMQKEKIKFKGLLSFTMCIYIHCTVFFMSAWPDQPIRFNRKLYFNQYQNIQYNKKKSCIIGNLIFVIGQSLMCLKKYSREFIHKIEFIQVEIRA